MPTPTNVRYVRVEVRPELLSQCDRPTIREVAIEVQTELDVYSLVELLPESDFMSRFDWFITRAKREILDQISHSSE